jgi:hypothetical protein
MRVDIFIHSNMITRIMDEFFDRPILICLTLALNFIIIIIVAESHMCIETGKY